jgi:uncharacterized protein
MAIQIDIPRQALEAFCHRYPIRRLSLFGSVLRDDFRPDSDVDVLVEFEPGAPITYFDMATMELELTDLIGREVDLREGDELSPAIRQAVLESAVLIHESERSDVST